MLKKMFSLLLCFTLAFTVLTGCGKKDDDFKPKTDNTESADTAVSTPNYKVEYFDGEENGVVAEVKGREVTAEEYEYFLMMSMYNEVSMAGGDVGDDFWTNDKIKTVMEDAMNQTVLSNVYVTTAKDNKLDLSDDDLKLIEEYMTSGAEYYGSEENFNMFFESQGLTREMFEELTVRQYYSSKLFEHYADENVSDKDINKVFKKDYVKAKHILISKTNEEGADVSADAYSKIEDIKAKLDDGADFDKLMNENSEDPGLESSPEGYVFTKGEMVAEFEEAAFALEPGQISDIVESQYGYHILMKVELTDKDLEETTSDAYGNQMTVKEKIKSDIASETFNSYIEVEKADAKVKVNNTEYNKFVKDFAKRFNDFMTKIEEVSNKLQSAMSEPGLEEENAE